MKHNYFYDTILKTFKFKWCLIQSKNDAKNIYYPLLFNCLQILYNYFHPVTKNLQKFPINQAFEI